MLTDFERGVLNIERRKLRAVSEKLPIAIAERNAGRVAGLAQAAEMIAARLVVLLDNADKRERT